MHKKCALILCMLFSLFSCEISFAQDSSYVDSLTQAVNAHGQSDSSEKDTEVTPEAKVEGFRLASVSNGTLQDIFNKFWVIIAALLVFFMQAGFKVFEVGLVRKKDRNSVGFKNLADWLVVTVAFWGIGFALMYGKSNSVLIGSSYWGLSGFGGVKSLSETGYEFFLFQLAFAATTVTIISGALAVRIRLISYMILALLVGGLIYPIFGHWVWGNLLLDSNKAWLGNWGFHDFAGSTVVHSLGAWVALTGMWFIRPRLGKRIIRKNQIEVLVPNEEYDKFEPHNLGYSVLGVLILWFGWWGFNGGSTALLEISETGDSLQFSSKVAKVLFNTNFAAAFGGLAAFGHCLLFQGKKRLYEKTLGGVLGALVAITAGCDVLSPLSSAFVGGLAGVLHNYSFDRLNERTLFGKIIDDPVGAIPVHGVCGILGTLCVALGHQNLAGSTSFLEQLGKQAVGVIVCALIAIGLSALFFFILRNTVGLEVEPHMEKEGKTI